MITQENNTNTKQFSEASAVDMPTLFCIGTVTGVGNGKITASENYIMQPVTIEALEAGRDITTMVYYRPEWLTVDFDSDTLKEKEKGAHFVYGKNIAIRGSLSALRGLSGSAERFSELSTMLLNLPVENGNKGPVIEDVQETLNTFFENNLEDDGSRKRIGYVLRQQTTKVLDAEGNPVKVVNAEGKLVNKYVKENRYQISEFFDPTEENMKKKAKSAARNPQNFKCTFEAGVLF